jgi:hypothetical protein
VAHRNKISGRRGRVKKNIVGDIVSAAGGAASIVSSGVGRVADMAAPYIVPAAGAAAAVGGVLAMRAAEEAGLIPKSGPVSPASNRRPVCPPGYVIGPGGNCYPRSLTSRIPTGPATEPKISVSTPGNLSVPSGFAPSLKSAAPAVLRGREVPDTLLPRAGGAENVLSSVSRHMGKVRKNIRK